MVWKTQLELEIW